MSGPFNYELLMHENCCICSLKTILKVRDHHYSDDFDDLNNYLRCVYPTLYIIRLLSRVYHFSLLICYSCSSGIIKNTENYLVETIIKKFHICNRNTHCTSIPEVYQFKNNIRYFKSVDKSYNQDYFKASAHACLQ